MNRKRKVRFFYIMINFIIILNIFPSKNQNERNEEELEQKLATLNALKDQQKSLFFTIISRFIETLNAYLNKLEDERKELSPHWFKWMSERFEDVLLIVQKKFLFHFYFSATLS